MNEELCEHGTLGGRRVDIPRSKGCLEWAKLLSANAGAKIPVPRDLPRAAALYDRACSAGQVDACLNLGGLLTYEPGIPHDYARALESFRRACESAPADPANSSPMFACVNVGIMFETGRGAPRDYRVAADNYERSCNATSVAGCQLLAEALEYGRGRAKDIARAAERYKRACGAGYTAACTAATRLAAARASTTTSPARE